MMSCVKVLLLSILVGVSVGQVFEEATHREERALFPLPFPSPSPSPSPSLSSSPSSISFPSPLPSPSPSPTPLPPCFVSLNSSSVESDCDEGRYVCYPSPDLIPSPSPSPFPSPSPSVSSFPRFPFPSPSPSPSPSLSSFPSLPFPSPSPSPSPFPSPSQEAIRREQRVLFPLPFPSPSPSPSPSLSSSPSPISFRSPLPSPSPSLAPLPPCYISLDPSSAESNCGEGSYVCYASPPIPSPSPSPSVLPSPSLIPSPTLSPISIPTPTPTSLPSCSVSLYPSSAVNPSVSLFFTAYSDCGEGRYVWSYKERFNNERQPFGGDFLCNGTNPKARCSGASIQVVPNAFAYNTTVNIIVQLITDSQNDPSASLTLSFPVNTIHTFLSVATNRRETMQLAASFQNLNGYKIVSYIFGCAPAFNGCPSCPGSPPYETTEPVLTLDFSNQNFENDSDSCEYNVNVEISFGADDSSSTSQAITTVPLSESSSIPLVQYDTETLTCGEVTNGNGIYFALFGLTDPDQDLEIVWRQIQGSPVTCPDNNNCGGNGTSFLFYPTESLNSCEPYEWEVIVTFPGGELVVPLCSAQLPGAPEGGFCSAMLGSSACANPLDVVTFFCSGWSVSCGSNSSIETQFFTVSEGTDVLIPAEIEPLSEQVKMPFQNTTYVTFVCNQGACTVGELDVSVCNNGTNQTDTIRQGFEEVERYLQSDNLEGALQTMVVLGDDVVKCEDVQVLSGLIGQYIIASLSSVNGNATNLPDTTTLMELLGVVATKNCVISVDLFYSLSLVCTAPTNPDVQTFAMNFLLENLLEQTDDDGRLDLIDEALAINECMQSGTVESTCGVSNPFAYSGDSFYHSQYVVPVSELQEGFSLEAPGTIIYFPENFDVQLAFDYRASTGDPIARYSCVIISLLETNTILETNVSVSSGIFGVNFYVRVNGSSVLIPVGHEGRSAGDVIIRIEKRSEESRARQIVLDEESECAYYLEGGILSTANCTTTNQTETHVFCSCNHFSNFGLSPFEVFDDDDDDSDSGSSPVLLPSSSLLVALSVVILAHLF